MEAQSLRQVGRSCVISNVTRRDLKDLFNNWEPRPLEGVVNELTGGRRIVGVSWWGRLTEGEVLERLYDIDSLPSRDDRFDTAREDIWQHRENNADWHNDWILTDPRFELSSNDGKLLAFLAETLHPDVRSDRQEVEQLRVAYNKILRSDRVELHQTGSVSNRPTFSGGPAVARPVPLKDLREAIGAAIYPMSAHAVSGYCDDLGMPGHTDQEVHPMSGKVRYVVGRLQGCNQEQLVVFASAVHAQLEHNEQLDRVLFELGLASHGGVAGTPKNLIFASTGPKPKIVLDDAVNNDVRIVNNAEHCLIYDRLIDPALGVTFQMLVDWWSELCPPADGENPANPMFDRLADSLSDVERMFMTAYKPLLRSYGFGLPALIPQVYLHYDPQTIKFRERSGTTELVRQRMDFLMLLPRSRRVVLELDGVHHYASDDGRASPARYAEMMGEDRRIRLVGYEVYRFGGAESQTAPPRLRCSARSFLRCSTSTA